MNSRMSAQAVAAACACTLFLMPSISRARTGELELTFQPVDRQRVGPTSEVRPRPEPEATRPEDRKLTTQGLSLSLSLRGGHTFSSDLRDSDARASVSRAGVDLDLSGPLAEKLRWTLTVGVESSWYNWSNVATLLPSGRQPIGNGLDVAILPGLAYTLDKEWTLVGGAIVEFTGEPDADVGDSGTYGGYLGAQYALSETLSFTFGARIQTRLQEDPSFFPLLGVRWRINDNVTLATEGPGARLAVKIDAQWTLSFFGRYERREFRLADDGAIREGIVRDTRIPFGVAIAWQPDSNFRLSLEGGAVVYQQFVFDDEGGNRLGRNRTRPAPFVGLSGRLTF